MYNAIIATVEDIRPIEGADRIVQATVANRNVVVSIDTKQGDVGVFFDGDGQLSLEFCKAHDLISYKDENGNKKGGYFSDKRRVTTQRFKGVKSEGLFMPLSSLEPFGDTSKLKVGDTFDTFNGVPICNKYYSPKTLQAMERAKSYMPKVKMFDFPKHHDTNHWRFVTFPENFLAVVTTKLHGTSFRYGNIEVTKELSWFQRQVNKFLPVFSDKHYKELLGTRNAVLPKVNGVYQGGYYTGGKPYNEAAKILEGKLHKDEIIYGEVVGFVNNTPLFKHSTDKIPTIKKRFGPVMNYSYGCRGVDSEDRQIDGSRYPETKVFVYRITQNGKDLSYYQRLRRCRELGIEHVPLVGMFLNDMTNLQECINKNLEVDDVSGEHISEGVCISIESPNGIVTYKEKSFSFRVLEGIAKENDDYVDAEEVA